MNFRPWHLSPVIVVLIIWVLATTSTTASDTLAEVGFLTPSSAHPLLELPATNGMGIAFPNALIIAGASIILATAIWAFPELTFLWNEPTTVEAYEVGPTPTSLPKADTPNLVAPDKDAEINPFTGDVIDHDN